MPTHTELASETRDPREWEPGDEELDRGLGGGAAAPVLHCVQH